MLTHNKIGSGGFGDVKLAFPVLFSKDFNSIVIQLELPMVAKRYIQKDTERNHRFPIPSPQALQLLQEGYPDQYSAAKRDLTDPAGFYKKYITMPLFNGQNLFDYLTQNEGSFSDKPISKEDVLKILMGLAIQIGKLHKRGIIHRDIKPENIIIGRNLSVYLIDFDFCAPNQDRVPYSGTKDYTDPDIMAAVGAGNSFERVSAQRDLFPFVTIIGFFIERCHTTLKPFLDGLSKHIYANLYKTTMSDIETSLGSIIQAFYRTEIRIPQQPQKQFELKEQWIRLNLGRKIYMV